MWSGTFFSPPFFLCHHLSKLDATALSAFVQTADIICCQRALDLYLASPRLRVLFITFRAIVRSRGLTGQMCHGPFQPRSWLYTVKTALKSLLDLKFKCRTRIKVDNGYPYYSLSIYKENTLYLSSLWKCKKVPIPFISLPCNLYPCFKYQMITQFPFIIWTPQSRLTPLEEVWG